MARGWESKGVEAQQQAAEDRTAKAPASNERPDLQRRRATLHLARTKALSDLQLACAPAHRGMLEQTIAEIDRQLTTLA